MADFFKMIEQARQLQGNMQKMQEELSRKIFTGSAGGGMVTVECDGTFKVRKVRIDPSVVNPNDIEMLEDLIIAATSDAQARATLGAQEEMNKITGGMDLPFKMPGFM